MRAITPQGVELIKRFEGFSPEPYRDAAGYLTIGYGHLIRPEEAVPDVLSPQEAEEWLWQDILRSQLAVLRLISAPLTDGQYDALVSFTFNLGAGALQRSTLRRTINRGDYCGAALEFRRWVWAGGKKLKGLIRRREAEIIRYYA